MGKPVPTAGADGNLVCAHITTLTTTRQSIAYSSGAKWLLISYRLMTSATAVAGQYIKVVFNAASDADAAGKFLTPGAYVPLFPGDDLPMDTESITRIDLISNSAAAADVYAVRVLAGV